MPLRFIETVDRPSSAGLAEFLREVSGDPGEIRRLRIAPAFSSMDVLGKAMLGRDVFLQVPELAAPGYLGAPFRSRGIEIVALPDATLLSRSLVVIAPGDYVYQGSIDWSIPPAERLKAVATFDPTILVDDAGVAERNAAQEFAVSERIGIPICGPGFPNFGHFLYDGLSMAIAIRSSPAFTDEMVFVGPELSEWQRAILAAVNILDRYEPVRVNTVFRALLPSTMLYGHLPFPSRFLRLTFDLLRMQTSLDREPGQAKVFLSRGDSTKRLLTNRRALEAAVRERGFEVVDPGRIALDDMIRLLGECRLVVGESGAGLANLGFCNFATRVLEIQGSDFADQYTRATCAVFGLRWHAYIVDVFDRDRMASAEIEASGSCAEIDIDRFVSVLDEVLAAD